MARKVGRGAERGGTLVELGVALGLAGLVLAGVAFAGATVARANRQLAATAAVQRDVAAALSHIITAVSAAGHCSPGSTAPFTVAATGPGTVELSVYAQRWTGDLRCVQERVTYRVVVDPSYNVGRLTESAAGQPASPLTSVDPENLISVAGFTASTPSLPGAAVQVCLYAVSVGAGLPGSQPGWRACSAALPRGAW